MSERENKLRQRLLATFKVEAAEHIANLSRELLVLEKGGADSDAVIETVFREAHSFKGAARAVNLGDFESVCQTLEDVIAAIKQKRLALDAALIDKLLQTLRLLREMLEALESDAAGPGIGKTVSGLRKLLIETSAAGRSKPTAATVAPMEPPAATAEKPAAAKKEPRTSAVADPAEEFVRVPTAQLYSVRLLAEELLGEKLTAGQLSLELIALLDHLRLWDKQWKKALPDLQTLERSDNLDNGSATRAAGRLTAFLDWNKAFFDGCEQDMTRLESLARQNQHTLAQKADQLLEASGQLLMMPCHWLLDGLEPMVRDLARDLGKDVTLAIEGASIEIDRRILTELKDPLVHILRNSVDHGIETPAQRSKAGKPARGTITLKVRQAHGNRVAINIRDDGAGIQVQQLKASAVKTGTITQEESETLTDADALELVFRSAVSTSPIITDLSGRGLGLAIVRDKVEQLGGVITIESQPGAGTTLTLNLPLSRATFRGVVIRSGERLFVVPTLNVERVTRVTDDQIRTVENRETVAVFGEQLALARLDRALGLPASAEDAHHKSIVVMTGGTARMAFLVDEIRQEQEVLMKGLGPQLQALAHLSGASVLADGLIAPILDVPELLRTALAQDSTAPLPAASAQQLAETARRKSILVAEDSITSRTLLKNILESANFSVETAVDGMDAFTKLRNGNFDLVVSDVDMPRLNGLSLTAKIRADKKYAELPVILVTSLDSSEDRERGIDVGANAYIVKRSFEQSNLLDVIQRLI